MNVVGIAGSPRRLGNSEKLLDRVLEGAVLSGARVEKIVINELTFKPCQECGGCKATGVCVIRDGMDGIYKLLREADAVVLATPIFFASVSAQTKMMIDRFQCAWEAKYNLRKAGQTKKRTGVLIGVAASCRKDFFDNARLVTKAFFATLDIEYSHELFCGRLEKGEDVDKNKELLDKAFMIGKDMVAK